jgi:RNA polymerase sigma-70 factor (ECF subfamily)
MSVRLPRARRTVDEDAELFTRLYEQSSRDLLAFLLRRCKTPDAAADCLAESYRIAWEKRDRIPGGDEARPWLFGVARNVVRRDLVRDQRTAAATGDLVAAAERAGATLVPQDTSVADALAELSELDREIMMMLSFDGLAPREVASILGLSANVVRVRAHRAREKLRGTLRSTEIAARSQSAESES